MKTLLFTVICLLMLVGVCNGQKKSSWPSNADLYSSDTTRDATYRLLQPQLENIFPNATLLKVEKRHPHMGIALPFALTFTAGGVLGFVSAASDKAKEDLQTTYTVAGSVSLGLAIAFWVAAIQTEDWAIYSNGVELKVRYTLK